MIAENIEDIYELSPMQRGMLFHTLYAPHSGVYIEQALYSFSGPLDVRVLLETWQHVVAQHPTLRTAFLWEELDEPMQVVYQQIQVPWVQHDWRTLSSNARYRQLDDLLAIDRRRGFDLAEPPLLRLTLIQVADDISFLLLTHHHLLLDGWSLSIVFQEALHTYRTLCTERGKPQFKSRRPYRDYIAWLRHQNLTEAEAYWRHYLQGFTVPTPLMIDTSSSGTSKEEDSPPIAENLQERGDLRLRGGRPVALEGFILPVETTTALRAFARRHQLTVNTLVQGAWALLLSRYSGETDIVFGATVAGRPANLPGAEAMVGLFINSLPVRVLVPAQATLLPWLAQLQAQQAEARQYDYSPLVQVQGWSEIERGQALFESLIVFENYYREDRDVGTQFIASRYGREEDQSSLHVEALQFLEQTNYPLVVIIGPGAALEVQLGYETARFASSTMRRMLTQLRILLEGFMTHSDSHLATIPLLNEAERQQLLSRWNQPEGSQPAHPEQLTLHQCFQQQVAHTPDAIVLVNQEQCITYADLEQRANQLAHTLCKAKVGPEVRVGLYMTRSLDLVIALLAILKAGGAYVPLDPAYPQERLSFILKDAQVPVLLTQQQLVDRLHSLNSSIQIICIDTEAASIAKESGEPPHVQVMPDNAAYVIYTSGSTGLPKGVVVTHRSLVNHATVLSARYRLHAGDRVLQFASISFDVAVEELFPSWLRGATVVQWPELVAPAPGDFSRFVAVEQLTVLNLPSSYWHEWVTELSRPLAQRPSTLRLVIVGSEKVSTAHFATWQDITFADQKSATGHHISWCNAYGLTETTVTSLLYEPPVETEGSLNSSTLASMPIGQPIANTQAYVLDTQLQPVPSGMPGELYIGGVGVARGYLHQPALTAERFVPHPFSTIPGARLYRTGDRVRYQADGTIEFLGRVDAQVKLRGFRVELGEIEALLSQHSAVNDVVVLAREDIPGETRLVAYIVARQHVFQLGNVLRSYLQDKLPSYMVPSAFVQVEMLPRTPSGKVNPRGLPAPGQAQTNAGGEEYVAPRTPLEEILATIWAAVLRLEPISRRDQFFKLGGHSLQATQVVARLRELLHIELPVRAIYDAPTIPALATTIERMKQGAQGQRIPPLQRIARTDTSVFPLSFAQQRLWFLDQLQPGSAYYNIPGAFSIKGSLDVVALEQSINALIQRHEALRTTFAMANEQPVQVIVPVLHVPLPVTELSSIGDASVQATEVARLVRAEARRSFDLQRGPLLRATLLRLQPATHVLLLTLHHIVADGWSANIFFHELHVAYTAHVTGHPPVLPELPIQYADYALWQREWLQGAIVEEQLAYWRTQLLGIPPVLNLPTDHPRPAMQTFQGAMSSFALSPSLTARLKALSQQESVTLFMTMLAAFQVLLARYSGQDDIAVGTPIAGRTRVQTEQLIGFFVNTLVLRTDLSGNPAFKEVLARVREISLEAYMHQDLPFERLVEEVQPQRSLSHSPLFQVLFMLQTVATMAPVTPDRSEPPNLSLEPLGIGSGTAKFDLSFDLLETPEGIEGVMEYNTDLFEATTIKRMLSHYAIILESIVADAEQPIAFLPLLTTSERQQMLIAWNDTRRHHPQQMCLHHLFEAQAAQTPDRVAVIFEHQHVTYRELNERANQLAHYLQSLGVGPDTVVGLCLERSPAIVVGVLGILKAGGAYTPLDPRYPTQRLAFLLADTRMTVLLTQQRLLEHLPALTPSAIRVLCLDSEWQRVTSQPSTHPRSSVGPEHLAYVIYTSGSTGTPKGVAMPHASLVNLFRWQQHSSALPEGARTLQFASLSFDVASQEIFCTLGFGHTLVLLTEELRRDPGAMLLKVSEEAIERLFLPVVALQQLAEAADEAVNVPTVLREVITAGEQLQITAHVVNLFERLPNGQLVNQYGPSESHVVSAYKLSNAPSTWSTLPPIGRPIDNTELYVLDTFMQPVPVGVPGELYIGGRGLARGYFARPDLTAERFVPHPFSALPGVRLYKTGDQVCYLPDGTIQFLGRRDQQVKIRGFRVELGEIEAVLTRHPAIHEAVVVAREDNASDKRLVAYIVTPQKEIPTTLHTQLRQYLQAQLPDYMIPSRFVVLEKLPLTSHGKIDLRALPVDTDQGGEDASSIVPHTPLEEVLAAIWSELLHRERVGVQDNFFDLGGHSLLATRMVARVREALKIVVPLRMVFEVPTIAGLVMWIEQGSRDSFAATDTVPLVPRPREETILPLSYAQERLWFLNQLDPASPAYTLMVALQIQGDLDIHALEESVNILIQRHEALRTTFIVTNGIPRQVIAPSTYINLLMRDLSDYSPSVRNREVERWSTEESLQPFDLSQRPLLRVTLLRLSEQEHRLLLAIHHSITDAWSMGILTSELSTVYTALVRKSAYSLPALPVQYADYALWQRRWLQGEVLEKQVSYWRKQLLYAPTVLNLPTDHPRPAVQSYRGDACFFPLPHVLSQELQALSRKNASTLFMTLLATLQILLFRYSGQTDLVIGTPIAGRSRSEVEGLIGLFVNTLALRTNLAGDPSFHTLLARVREVCLEAYAHQDVPFEKVVEAVQPERSLSHHPLFQVMFMVQNTPPGDLTLAELDLRPLPLGSPTTKFDLTVEFTETPTGLHGVVEYNTDLFERATIERLIQHYQQLLEGIVRSPEQHISLLPLLDEEERHRQLVEWNATANDAIPSVCVHQLFEEQALRSPDAIALIYDGQQLTFAELNRRANQLAHVLQTRGVQPEVCVGMYMARSLEMVIGVLGVLKAGGAYVPLDPAFPSERLAFMLQETQAPLVLTQQHLQNQLPTHTAQAICLDSDWPAIAQANHSSPACTATSINLAYIIYTSGSTGKPKGVQIEHRGLTNYLCWCLKAYAVEQGEGSLLHSSLASDMTITSLFAPLLAGQCLTILPEEQGLDALGEALCRSQDLSLVKLTPAHLLLLAEQLATRDVSRRTRALIIGGEALLQEHLAFWRIHAPETRFINEYGPTETVVGCCIYELTLDEKRSTDLLFESSAHVVPGQEERKGNQGTVPIGRPIANTQLYLLDQHFQPVPIGVPGELYIGGRGVARGYLQRPELTAERFLPNPFSQEPGARFYRPGDMARYLPDGTIEFLGRNDTQVKLRGYRIELGEVEAVLRGHSEVQEAVVLLEAQGSVREHLLVAYVVGQPSSTLSTGRLRSYLREHLPDYMVPTLYVILEALPLSSNGKVDRRALRLVRGQSAGEQGIAPKEVQAGRDPRSPLEETLVEIWAQVLGRAKVGIDDNFFDLGGHSLLVTQVISRVRERLQVELPLRTLFETPTIADFAEAIIQQELAQADSDELMRMLEELEGLSVDEV